MKGIRAMAEISSLDRTDRAIVALLQDNARLSNKEIAGTVGIVHA